VTRSLALLFAQVGAEVLTRLRSTSTLLAAIGLFVASFLWIQDPASQAISVSWRASDGAAVTGIYSAGFVGLISAVLAAGLLPLVGFYLVAGSVRRDREAGMGAILAATPLSNSAYLVGKWLAHSAYLGLLQALALVSGVLAFLRHGSGPFQLEAFLTPSLLLVTPAIALTAALAVLFDVTPGLRGRGGLVVYFFTWAFAFLTIPAGLGGLLSKASPTRAPWYDPAGIVTLRTLVSKAFPDSVPNSVAVGLITSKGPMRRVPWPAVPYSADLVALRVAGLLFVIAPLAAAVLVFDRFDPARSQPRRRERATLVPFNSRSDAAAIGEALFSRGLAFRSVVAHPGLLRSILAEMRLIWDLASWLRWPLLIAALLSGLVPAATPLFLLLLAPVISEVAALESLHGTRALVFSQPGVPGAVVLWKAAAVAGFLLILGAPGILRACVASPARGLAFVTGLLFVAAFAAAAASLTGGGKLFTAAYTALWYMAVSGGSKAGALDYSGVLGGTLETSVRLGYLALGAVALALAVLVEQGRRRA
jgi:hypothetical protein